MGWTPGEPLDKAKRYTGARRMSRKPPPSRPRPPIGSGSTVRPRHLELRDLGQAATKAGAAMDSLDESMRYTWAAVGDSAPNCRCVIVPVRPTQAQLRQERLVLLDIAAVAAGNWCLHSGTIRNEDGLLECIACGHRFGLRYE